MGADGRDRRSGLARTAARGAIRGMSKSAAKSAAAGAATGGTSTAAAAAAGAAKAVISNPRSRRQAVLLAAAVALLPIAGLFAAVTFISTATSQTVAGDSNIEAQTAANLSSADYSAYQQAGRDDNVPWEVLAAVAYYESGPGANLGGTSGTCPAGRTVWSETYCPNVASPGTSPAGGVPGGNGPMGLTARSGVSPTQAGSVSTSAATVASDLQTALDGEPSWASGHLSFGDGEQLSSLGEDIDLSDPDAETVAADYPKAIDALPVAGMDPTLAFNVYGLAVDWYLGQTPTPGNPPVLSGLVCGVTTGQTLQVSGPGGTAVTLNATELSNIAITVHEGKALGFPTEGLVIAVGTELTESSAYNLPNPAVPGSMTNPAAQFGDYSPSDPPDNGTSVDPFQQQDNWGSEAQRMNLTYSAAAFFGDPPGFSPHPDGLAQIPNWQQTAGDTAAGEGDVAQAVQGSEFPTRYQEWMPAADTAVGAVEHIPCSGGSVSVAGDTAQAKTIIEAAEYYVTHPTPYVYGGGTDAGPSGSAVAPAGYVGKPGFDCSGLVMYALNKAGISVIHYSGLGGDYSLVLATGTYTTDLSRLAPGDLVFFTGSDGSASNPGHVGIYIGGDRMIDAPETGMLVQVDTVSTFPGFLGGGAP